MKLSDIKDTIYSIVQQDTPVSLMLYGPPGVGKTAIVSQVARDLSLQLYTLALPTCEAVDVRGIPQVENTRTVWRSPFPQGGKGILLLDELTSAPPDVQVAAHHILWRERGSDLTIASGWHVIATGNRATDRALYRPLSAPLRNRILMLTVESDLDTWTTWALDHQIRPEIIGFLRWRPELLISKDIPESGAFVSPRAWERVSTVMQLGIGNHEVYDGVIGEGPSIEFTAYLHLTMQLPTIEHILQAPSKADVPTSPALLYALTSAFSSYTKTRHIIGMEYLKRLPAEYTLLYIRDIRGSQVIKDALKQDPATRDWVKQHLQLFKDDPL